MDANDSPRAHRDLTQRLLAGDGHAPGQLRRAAFERTDLDESVRILVEKVAMHAHLVTDDDFDTARWAGLSEDQIWEVVICAAVGQATRQYEAGIRALDQGLRERADP